MSNENVQQDGKRRFDWYQYMTDVVVEHLESDTGIFDTIEMVADPYNGATGKIYDFNSKALLMLAQMRHRSDDPRFYTFNQITKLGYHVRAGAKSQSVIAVDEWKDVNGKPLPKEERKSHFENVFHISDMKQHIPVLDEQGRPVPFEYKELDVPFYNKVDKKSFLAWSMARHDASGADEIQNAFYEASDNVLKEFSSDNSDKAVFRTYLAAMMVSADTTAVINLKQNFNTKEIVNNLKNDKKEFANAVFAANKILKEFKALTKKRNIIVDIGYDYKPLDHNKSANEPEKCAEVAKEPEKCTEMANICYAIMKSMGLNKKEMLSAFSSIKAQGEHLVRKNMTVSKK